MVGTERWGPVTHPGAPKRVVLPLAPGETLLPRGRVETTYIVDPEHRPPGRKWRMRFDLAAYELDGAGGTRPEPVWKLEVMHVLKILEAMRKELVASGREPIFLQKEDGDRIRVCFWKGESPPAPVVEAAGMFFEATYLPRGMQHLESEDLNEIDDLALWPR